MAHVHHETPQEHTRSLNLWLVFVLVLVLAAGAALALVLVLKDDDKKSSPPTTTTQLPAKPTTPEEFAKEELYADWKAGDRFAAAVVASTEAIDQMFAVPYEPIQTNDGPTDPYTFRRCEGAAGSQVCTWSGKDNAQIIMTVRDTTGGLPVLVVAVQRQGG